MDFGAIKYYAQAIIFRQTLIYFCEAVAYICKDVFTFVNLTFYLVNEWFKWWYVKWVSINLLNKTSDLQKYKTSLQM